MSTANEQADHAHIAGKRSMGALINGNDLTWSRRKQRRDLQPCGWCSGPAYLQTANDGYGKTVYRLGCRGGTCWMAPETPGCRNLYNAERIWEKRPRKKP
jgi:hypothetical protein